MNNKIFSRNWDLDDLDSLYDFLANHSEWLNEFLARINDKIFEKIKWDKYKQLKITLEYLEPILKSGDLEARIEIWFNNNKDLWKFLNSIKTELFRAKIIKLLNQNENLELYYNYSRNEIETFKEDVQNIMFKYCENDEERQKFEEFNIAFRLPWTFWELEWSYII